MPENLKEFLSKSLKAKLDKMKAFNNQLRELKKVAYYKKLVDIADGINNRSSSYPSYETISGTSYAYPTNNIPYPSYDRVNAKLLYNVKTVIISSPKDDNSGRYYFQRIKTYYNPYIDFNSLSLPHTTIGASGYIGNYIANLQTALRRAKATYPAPPEDMYE